jgi:uncharacterized protein YkwD
MKKIITIVSIIISYNSISQNPVKLIDYSKTSIIEYYSMDSVNAFNSRKFDSVSIQIEFLRLLNQYRKFKGLGELQLDVNLCAAADNQCRYMVNTKYVGHVQDFNNVISGDIYPTLTDRILQFYPNYNCVDYRISENALCFPIVICFGRNRTVAQQSLDQWASSNKGHAQAQLNPNFTKIGISFIKSPIDTKIYAVTVFSNK